MDGSERWLPALVVMYVLIVAAMLFYFVISGSVRDRRYEIGDLRRDIGEVPARDRVPWPAGRPRHRPAAVRTAEDPVTRQALRGRTPGSLAAWPRDDALVPGRGAERGEARSIGPATDRPTHEGNAPPVAGRGRKKAAKAVARRKRSMTEEQRKAVAERMRNYWASRRAAKAQDKKAQE